MAGRLTKKEFYKCMKYLRISYINFNLNLEDVDALDVWYDSFKHLTNAQVVKLVKSYKSEFAPQSPQSLLKLLDEIEDSKESAEEFAQYLLQVNRQHGFNWNTERCLKEVRDKYGTAGYSTATLFAEQLKNLKTSDVPVVAAQIREAFRQQKRKNIHKNEFGKLFDGANKHIKRLN